MVSAVYDWKLLSDLGVAAIVAGLQAPGVRDVDLDKITPEFAERLAADGLGPTRAMTVLWSSPPPSQDTYVFQQPA